MHVNFVLHINRRLRLLACLLAVGVHAFAPAPILWGVVHTKSFVLAPKHVLGKTLGSIRAAGPADELMLWDPSGMIPTSEIPRFTVKPDRTITWDSTDLCIEASGHNTGDFVNLNRCSAEWTQLWDVLSLGFKQKQIQLRGTNMCLDVVDNGGVDRNRIQLQECANRATESWVFEQSTPPSKQKPTQRVDPSFLLRHVIVACGAMIGLTALSLKAWQWHQQHKKCEVIVGHNDVPLNVDEGGVCLTMPLRLSNIRMMSSPGRLWLGRSARVVARRKNQLTNAGDIGPGKTEDVDCFDHAAAVGSSYGASGRFDVEIDRSTGISLGLDINYADGKTLLIRAVEEGGLLAAWNAQQVREMQVAAGDRIVIVNGSCGTASQLMDECRKHQLLVLTLQRPPEFFFGASTIQYYDCGDSLTCDAAPPLKMQKSDTAEIFRAMDESGSGDGWPDCSSFFRRGPGRCSCGIEYIPGGEEQTHGEFCLPCP